MATAEKSIPSPELSELISSVPVVMIYLNGLHKHQVPGGVQAVTEVQSTEKPSSTTGRKIDEEKSVSLSKIIAELNELGYRPVRSLAFQRQNKKHRAVLTFVQWRHMKDEDSVLPRRRKEGFQERLAENLWDVRIFRNHSQSGGNFVIDCGNPHPALGGTSLFLGIQEDEFGFFSGEEAED